MALNTDRLANSDDPLPNLRDDNRRGWWGDLDAQRIWQGWPIGTRLWLLGRAKITGADAAQGSTLVRAEQYIAEAIQPLVDARICSSFSLDNFRVLTGASGDYGIAGRVTLFRGPKAAIALEYDDLWKTFGG